MRAIHVAGTVMLAAGLIFSAPHPVWAHKHHHCESGPGFALGAVGNGWSWYGSPYFMTIGPNGPMMFAPGMPFILDRGAVGGAMPPLNPAAIVPKARRADPTKSAQLVTVGDRLFRAGNLKRASERYEQALRAAPDLAAPRVHLAQVALSRGDFAEAASLLRAAIAAEPGWLPKAPDIQAVYGEPKDFAKQIARLESRVQIEPGDRNAWFVLGAELFLSGRTRRAGDIFVRLSDRQGDPALAAFLSASKPVEDPAK